MKLSRMLVLGLLLTGLVLAQPQPGPAKDYEAFLAGLTVALFDGNYPEVARRVRANPAFAKNLGTWQLSPRKQSPPAMKLLEQRLTTIIALELARGGDRSLLLKAQKLGVYQADMADYHPKPRLSLDAPGFAMQNRAQGWAFGLLKLSESLGDNPSLQPAANNLRAIALHRHQINEKMKLIPMDDTLDQVMAYCNCLPMLVEIDRGNSLAVDDATFFDQMEKLSGSCPEALLFGALRRNASPARLQKMLAEGRRRGRAKPGSLADFIYQTYEFDLRLQRDARVTPEEVLDRHDQAILVLRQLKDLDLEDLPAPEVGIWFEHLARLLRQPQVASRAQATIGHNLGVLQKAVDATSNEDYALGSPWLWDTLRVALQIKEKRILLNLARLYLAADRPRQARQVLDICGRREAVRDRLQTQLAEMEKTVLNDAPAADIAALAKQGIVFQPVQPHWHDGYLARLMEDWTGLEMALQEDPARLPQLFAEADQFGQKARANLGWMGFDDPRWFYLNHLFTHHPADWQASSAPVLASLKKDCDQLAFRPGQARLLAYQADLVKSTHPDLALTQLNQAVALVESYLNEFGASPTEREQLQQAYQPIYTALAQLQIEHGKGEQAFETLQRQQLVDAVNRNSLNLAADPRAEALLRVRGQGQELDAQFQANVQAGRDNAQTEQLLAKNKAEFHTVLTDLRRQYPSYESALAIRPTNFSKTQKYLPADAAVIQYFPTATTLYLFLVTRDKLIIRQVPLGEKQLQREVSRLMVEMFKPVSVPRPSYSFNQADPGLVPLRDCLFELHKALITPVEGDLAGVKVLAFIPTGCLHYVPFAALARPRGQGLEFLVERFPCVNLVKSSDLDQVGRPSTPGDGGLLALGNPDGTLPGAEREVAQIASHFSKSKKLLGEQATSVSLKALDPGTRYLHMATHGVLNSFDPKKSYLLMAGSHLTIPEVYELNLEGLRLVTLSACQTAREGSSPGSEISSLAEAFSVAGTNSVVASLWSVSDTATEKLMGEFYAGLIRKESLATSLQQAELALLKDPATAHPFFWAPFVMLGDWR